jgi:hypothetical protein
MKYAVYKSKLVKTESRDLDGGYFYRIELVYIGEANSMEEAKKLCAVPVLERLAK